MKPYRRQLLSAIILIIVFALALSLRLYGLNWDQNSHLHPDERFLTMVSSDISLPKSISQYFDTHHSPLNPANHQYGFFVYGTFPIFITKLIAVLFNFDGYEKIYLVGRVLSAIFDTASIVALYFISKKIFDKKSKLLFLPSFLYAFSVLPIQLSHFYAVDTFLSLFMLLCFTFLCYRKYWLSSICFGLALTCKISAIYLLPIIGLFLLFELINHRKIGQLILVTIASGVTSLVIFRVFQPYAFDGLLRINPLFIENIKTLQSYSDPDSWFPPAIQWLSKTPLIFSLQNIAYWGVGLPIFISLVVALILFITQAKFTLKSITNPKSQIIISVFVWIIMLYLYQGSQFAHTMRYFIPIYPFIFLAFSYLVDKLSINRHLLSIILILHLIWGLAFFSIYSRPYSRIQASEWIYDHLPAGSNLTNEHWDDALPITLSPDRYLQLYPLTTLNLYDFDTIEKWDIINEQLKTVDYIVMSSNRLWASIPLVPSKYPITTRFYQDLFDEKLGFRKIAQFQSYPGFSLPFLHSCYYFGPTNYPYLVNQNRWFSVDNHCQYPGIYIRDDIAEEAFSVYDHPQILIYQRSE